MFANEIYNILKKYRQFAGIYARDELPENIQFPTGLVVNSDKRDEPGTHWLAIYIDRNGFGEYFDSYGFPPYLDEITKFLFNACPNGYFYNRYILQCLTCITCGQYCTSYLCARFNGIPYSEYISKFTNNPYTNDKIIKNYFNV